MTKSYQVIHAVSLRRIIEQYYGDNVVYIWFASKDFFGCPTILTSIAIAFEHSLSDVPPFGAAIVLVPSAPGRGISTTHSQREGTGIAFSAAIYLLMTLKAIKCLSANWAMLRYHSLASPSGQVVALAGTVGPVFLRRPAVHFFSAILTFYILPSTRTASTDAFQAFVPRGCWVCSAARSRAEHPSLIRGVKLAPAMLAIAHFPESHNVTIISWGGPAVNYCEIAEARAAYAKAEPKQHRLPLT